MNKELKGKVIQKTLKYMIPLLIIAAVIYSSISYTLITSEYNKQSVFMEEETRVYAEIVKSQVSDAEFLASHIKTDNYLRSGDYDEIEELLKEFTREKGGTYYQAKFIDVNGVERVKMKFNKGQVENLSDALEDKSDRYYMNFDFDDEFGVYLSKIDLNIENGVIEEPYQPVLRIVKPVISNNVTLGYVVLNYNMKTLLNRMNGNYKGSSAKLYLISDKGEWVVGPSYVQNFGNMFPGDPNALIENTDNDLWEKIFIKNLSTGDANGGIFSTATIISNDLKTFNGKDVALEEEWRLISLSKYGRFLGGFNQLFFAALFTLIFVTITFVYIREKSEFAKYESEADILSLEGKLKIVTDSVYDSIVMIDSRGHIKFWNKTAQTMFGYTDAEVMDRYVHDLIAPSKYRDVSGAGMEKFKKSGKGPIIGDVREVDALRKDGTTFPAELMVNSVMINNEWWAVGVIRDITKRVRTMKELKKLSRAVENSKDIIFITDKTGNILYVNSAFIEVTGFSRMEAIVSKPSIMSKDEESDNQFSEIIAMLKDKGSYTGITVNRRKDGSLFYYDQTVSAIYDDSREIINYISTGKDITDRVHAQQELKETMEQMEKTIMERTQSFELAKEEAESANRAKSAFLAHMSHEIRTPLNAIIGFAQLLINESDLDDKELDQVTTIFDSGEHLLSLINDILEISRIESGKVTINNMAIDFERIIQEIERIFMLKTQTKGLYLNVRFENMLEKAIVIDGKKLRQILLNIVGNAVKFTSQGGIELIAEMVDKGDDSGSIICTISDSADGIPPEDIEKIFNPFEQSSDLNHRSKGTGLGLAITKSFIEKMGGHIKVESVVGQGSTFEFEIPVTFTDLSNIENETELSVKIIKINKPISILIVDDQPSNRKLLENILEYDEMTLYIATNGEEAVEIVRHHDVDCIFMDIRMPVMNGIEATQIIRAEGHKDMVICALTASVFEHQANDILSKGFDKLIRKPFRTNEIYHFLSDNFDMEVQSSKKLEEDQFIHHDLFDFSSVNAETVEMLDNAIILGDVNEIKDMIEERDDVSQELKVRIIDLCNQFDLISLNDIVSSLKANREN